MLQNADDVVHADAGQEGGGVGRLLRAWRNARRWSLEETARRANLARVTLNRWETGVNQPRLPELAALLDALGVSEPERRQALVRMSAPRAALQLRRDEEKAATAVAGLVGQAAEAPRAGDLLRALRVRRGLAPEAVAAGLGVRTRTVRRWERGETALPAAERLDELCALLGARPEERAVLADNRLLLSGAADQGPLSPEDLARRLDLLLSSPVSPTAAALMELNYFMLEAEAWRLSVRRAATRSLLTRTFAYHANYLGVHGRQAEAGRYAERALDSLYGQDRLPADALLAAIWSARVAAAAGARPARGLEVLDRWLARAAPWPEYECWMLAEMAYHAAGDGQVERAPALAEAACIRAEHLENRSEWDCRRVGQARVLLRCERPREALSVLPEAGGTLAIEAALLRAEALHGLGDPCAAHTALAQAYVLLERYAPEQADIVAIMRPQADALARRL